MHPPKATVAIISPALRIANNGNWQTAHRWSHFLQADYGVTLAAEWAEGHADGAVPACLIALHARRSVDPSSGLPKPAPTVP